MDRIPVSSSNIAEVGYDEQSTTLEILFLNQSIYQYFDVPKDVYDSLVSATSVGQYFNANIRGEYRFAKV
jgi:KTSC domain